VTLPAHVVVWDGLALVALAILVALVVGARVFLFLVDLWDGLCGRLEFHSPHWRDDGGPTRPWDGKPSWRDDP
jgi:hypothetical protein